MRRRRTSGAGSEVHAAVSVAHSDKDARAAASVHSGGHATLDFTRAGDGRTFISKQEVSYPFHITRPFYPAGDPEGMATVYLQSVSGGIYEDDTLELSLAAKTRARAHVTTQSASIVHGMTDKPAVQRLGLVAHEGALLEYWPDPMILFPRARLRATVSIEAAPGSIVLLCDAYLGHDPEGGDRPFAELACEISVKRPRETLACAERFDISGAEMAEHGASAGFAHAAYGTVLCLYDTDAFPGLAPALQTSLDRDTGVYAGATMLPSQVGLCAKILARGPEALNLALDAAWRTLREALTGAPPPVRRK